MSTYTKSALDTPDLLGILKQRGLVITNEADALHTLSVISYFRLASLSRSTSHAISNQHSRLHGKHWKRFRLFGIAAML